MKGIVFSVKKPDRALNFKKRTFRNRTISFKRFWIFYGVQTFFVLVFILGIILGAKVYHHSSTDFLSKLDFLFLTNLSNRLKLSAFDVFCTSFASNFIFIFLSFIFGLSVWGMFALPLLCSFKGVGTGISSTYLLSEHSISGIGFFILVILPGVVLFLFAFVAALKEAFIQSFGLIKLFFPHNGENLLQKRLKTYVFRNAVVFILVVFSSVLDMLLWVLFANMFNF